MISKANQDNLREMRDWFPVVKMSRVIMHWTGGTYKASSLDLEHYHVVTEEDGTYVKGTHSIANNVAPIRGAAYAAHTLNCNGGSIGISAACMGGAVQGVTDGKYPLTARQADAMVYLAAVMCHEYNIPVSAHTVLQHGEVAANLRIAQRAKWDIMRLPFAPSVTFAQAGDWWRTRIDAKLSDLKESLLNTEPVDAQMRVNVLVGEDVRLGGLGLLQDSATWVPLRVLVDALNIYTQQSWLIQSAAGQVATLRKSANGISESYDMPLSVNGAGVGFVRARDLANAYGLKLEFERVPIRHLHSSATNAQITFSKG